MYEAKRFPIPNPEDGGKTTWWRTAVYCVLHQVEVATCDHPDRQLSRKGAWAQFRSGNHCPECGPVVASEASAS